MKLSKQNGSILLEGAFVISISIITGIALLILLDILTQKLGMDFQKFQSSRRTLNGKTINF